MRFFSCTFVELFAKSSSLSQVSALQQVLAFQFSIIHISIHGSEILLENVLQFYCLFEVDITTFLNHLSFLSISFIELIRLIYYFLIRGILFAFVKMCLGPQFSLFIMTIYLLKVEKQSDFAYAFQNTILNFFDHFILNDFYSDL